MSLTDKLKTGLVGLVLTAGMYATPARASPIVDIYENDNLPIISGTSLGWDYVVQNNSNTQPIGNPYNEKITEVKLYDIWSITSPTAGSLPSHWSLTSSAGSGNNLWNVDLTCNSSLYYISPGNNRIFSIDTYRPDALTDILVGDRYGQGLTQGHGLQPYPTGDVFEGPIGVPEPSTLGLGLVGLTYVMLRRPTTTKTKEK